MLYVRVCVCVGEVGGETAGVNCELRKNERQEDKKHPDVGDMEGANWRKAHACVCLCVFGWVRWRWWWW